MRLWLCQTRSCLVLTSSQHGVTWETHRVPSSLLSWVSPDGTGVATSAPECGIRSVNPGVILRNGLPHGHCVTLVPALLQACLLLNMLPCAPFLLKYLRQLWTLVCLDWPSLLWVPSLPRCYGLNVCVPPPRVMCWSPNPQCDRIRRWGLWKVMMSWRSSPHDGISALIRRGTREMISLSTKTAI